ncbi:MAG: hypothetical protein KF727_13035 [Microbacteriaceae bacterium]|nr:hypothetical protein [Microbacteriaceae bacterium]
MTKRKADIWLGPASAGGLSSPLPSGTHSMLLYFVKDGPRDPIGVVITSADGGELRPDGSNRQMTLEFWSPEADSLPESGSVFAIWYSRFVGVGVLTGP